MKLFGECIAQDNLLFAKSIFVIHGSRHSLGAPGISRKYYKKVIMNFMHVPSDTLRIILT